MMLAQHLYEEGLITYMRTDSLNISKEALADTSVWIKENLGDKYTLNKPRVFKTKSKSAQEAHEAIRPTNVTKDPQALKNSVGEQELKLYDLIWKRFVASQLPEAIIENTKVDIAAHAPSEKNNEYIFHSSGIRLLFDGFLKIYTMKLSENILPELKKNDELKVEAIAPLQHFTEPPPRYNEASLIKTLEDLLLHL